MAYSSPSARRKRRSRRSIWPRIGFVIVSHQVKHAMKNQNAHLVVKVRPKRSALRRATAGAMAISPR